MPHAILVVLAALSIPLLCAVILLSLRIRQWDARAAVIARRAAFTTRESFADDVHDLIGSRLWLAALRIELAQRAAQEDPALRRELAEVGALIRRAAADIRDTTRSYRELTLRGEVAGAGAVLRAFGIECRIELADLPLPAPVDTVLAVVVRESLTNVLRHSAARTCSIELAPNGDGVRFTVENDGVAPIRATSGGRGLASLRRRLATVGGTIQITTDTAGRFRLTTEIPHRDP